MFYFYVLQSLMDNQLYFGYTADLKRRFKEHSDNRVIATRRRQPMRLVYYEAYSAEKDVRAREFQIKRRAKAYIGLKCRITNSLIIK